ncbi:MAG: hypothetical protein AB1563_09450 [Bacillota bacterium]
MLKEHFPPWLFPYMAVGLFPTVMLAIFLIVGGGPNGWIAVGYIVAALCYATYSYLRETPED